MQRGLLHVTRSLSAVHSSQNLVGPSRLPLLHLQSRHASSLNPLNWLRQKFAAELREKETKEQLAAAKQEAKAEGQLNLFEASKPVAGETTSTLKASSKTLKAAKKSKKAKPTSHKYSTASFKISPRKLNMLGNQISGKPIDYAILQMQFSEKRASKRIMNMLATARDHAVRYKHLEEPKLVVAEAWVNKAAVFKRIEPRGRGHYGLRKHKYSRMHVVLKEGETLEEKKARERAYKLKRVVSAAVVREDRPIRNPGAMWAW